MAQGMQLPSTLVLPGSHVGGGDVVVVVGADAVVVGGGVVVVVGGGVVVVVGGGVVVVVGADVVVVGADVVVVVVGADVVVVGGGAATSVMELVEMTNFIEKSSALHLMPSVLNLISRRSPALVKCQFCVSLGTLLGIIVKGVITDCCE